MTKVIIVLSALLCAALAAPSSHEGKVVGGNAAGPGEFPYIVSMRNSQGHTCGGSIISPSFVLTAAHCVYGQSPQGFYIVVGVYHLNEAGTQHGVSSIIVHPGYNPQNNFNDIALMQVSSPFQYSQLVQPVQLETRHNDAGGDRAVLSGWGLTGYPGNISPQLQWIYLNTINQGQCAQALAPQEISVGTVCTFNAYGQGSCQGDSGGPLVGSNGRQCGVVSWGRPCAIGYPDVFTSVAFYIDWIRQYVNV